MNAPEQRVLRVPLSRSQQNLYNGVLQDGNPALYLIGKSYRFHPLELTPFLAALEATILESAGQLCVLETSATETGYPALVPRLQFDDIVCVHSDDHRQSDQTPRGDDELKRAWSSGILGKPLVRYTVLTDEDGQVSGLDVHTHHILVDGGATAIIEADLARHLTAGRPADVPSLTAGLTKLTQAHHREAAKVEESLQRLADAVQRELADEARYGGHGQDTSDVPGMAAKGILDEMVKISGGAYDAILALSETKQVPLNVLVAAAAVAVDASLRQSTEGLLVHPVDNRFGDPDLNVATCLVNSVAHAVRFSPFASVQDVVRMLDRGYVKAVRRRWFREEHYRRMYLAINRTSHVEALTLNFIRQACAPDLRPFLSEAPVATDIGPVEGMTVACVLDEDQRTLDLAIWNRADLPPHRRHHRVAERIAAALESMAAMWDQPIAMTVDEWFGVSPDGARRQGDWAIGTVPTAPAWFLDAAGDVHRILESRPYVSHWVTWLVQIGAVPGDVLVFTDDNTDRTIDLLIACHLAGCGYSVCDTPDQISLRANAIADHVDGVAAHVVDMGAVQLPASMSDELQQLLNERITRVAQDVSLATKTAYVMPTSGSTGQPKLVRISHGSLALFCAAVRRAYGWGPHDTILQCAPLTSDISVEEIFGGAICGSELARSTGMKTGDLDALARDLVDEKATVVDLPTAVWHLICEDDDAIDTLRRSHLRQIVIGGEAIRPSAVDKWLDSGASQEISLVSTYGPTETTVVVTYLPIAGDGTTVTAGARLRLGRPVVPNSVFIAFGEVVIVGDLVSAGYLGTDDRSFGTVTTSDGSRRRAFATADRVTLDAEDFPVFAGRKDAIVKISGKRVDIAEVTRRIYADPAVSDVAVELHDGRLGVWFETRHTREAAEDAAAAERIRLILVSSGVSTFFVVGVPSIPRKPNGKVDSDNLRTMPQFVNTVLGNAGAGEKAAGLAEVWSRHLGRTIRPDSSLLGEGVGSLDLIRILPDTRRYLGRHVSILDLISADTAANLIDDASAADAWMDVDTAAEIEGDLTSLWPDRPAAELSVKQSPNSSETLVVMGASGVLGTGFAQAVLELRRSGVPCPDVVLVTRSKLPEHNPWAALRSIDGVRIEQLSAEFGRSELEALIHDTRAGTVVNCIGNTNVLVPYRELRPANVGLVSAITEACASNAAKLVHLSTFVVNADVTAPRVTDPRDAPYPYAASKSLAELVVAGSPQALDFTIVRLPRVLGEDYQLHDSADILLSVVDACNALQAFPSLTLTEEVTTGRAVANAILGRLAASAESTELGRGITVVRGEAVEYGEFLSGYAFDELDVAEWKYRLDESDWAKNNPRRWSVVDAWLGLGMRLGARSYAEYLADYPTIALGVDSVAELAAPPQSLRSLVAHGFSRSPEAVVG
ncbi:peptide synthase [Mycobacterium sp. 852002-51163_SCH5372311]|uniref:AMP-binding protein n=1 Tax=Mycobacterium sp. 852002-51163_SCH5372311 TaxID=1834097 RepID=UPI000801D039|nr:AMP-binding protein [Mycobacterium sp. 852002-51163_SCH5372311]OBF91812.1 peptide synthase [Mycobacterium sp. 852002-51163_SCH5372311]